jgi:3-oxoadipate enol-lactonase
MSPRVSKAADRRVDSRGLDLFVRDNGKTSAPAVVLAHGMWCEGGMFAAVAKHLAGDYRVVIPDFRAHGRSEVPATSWTISDLALDLIAILDTIGVERAVIAGFSMGGMAALQLAISHPERIGGLVLLSTSAGPEERFRILQIGVLVGLLNAMGPQEFIVREAARTTFSRDFRRSSPEPVERWERALRAMTRPALVQALQAIAERPSVLKHLGQIKVPVHIVTGSDDRVLRPRWSQAMHERIRGSRLTVFEESGHAVPVERPEDTAQLIAALIEEAGPTGRRP